MWITKLLVEKLDKEDKKISEGSISDKDIMIKGCLMGLIEGTIDGCLLVGVIQLVRGTIRLITRK